MQTAPHFLSDDRLAKQRAGRPHAVRRAHAILTAMDAVYPPRIGHDGLYDRYESSVAELREENDLLRRQADAWRRAHDLLLLELRVAEQVQNAMLPRVLPRPAGVEFGASVLPLQHLAGDFYNVFRLDEHRVGFYVGDVVGHGPAAALVAVHVMQTIRPKRGTAGSCEILTPSEVMEQLNRDVMAAAFPNEPFLTMVYGILDTSSGVWTYCCCGHPPALILRPGEEPMMLEATAPLLGIFDAPFREAEVTLEAGDRLVLYSDGGNIASWGSHGYGLEGLASYIGTRDGRSPQSIVDSALASSRFDSKCPDDITLLIAQIDS